ncbi:unnamed protein product [Polarella glacialis]|uniref:C2 domain-containing protein n=1 Tax=Polarella glacialis TaxID=89957 RepID=A0A813EPS1_POLGL|nr:unnamed protein product [Polarella glacialis]
MASIYSSQNLEEQETSGWLLSWPVVAWLRDRCCDICGGSCYGAEVTTQPGKQSSRRGFSRAMLALLGDQPEDQDKNPFAEGKGELVNDFIAAEWPFISKWFEGLMREACEPILKKLMPPGVTICFGERCGLGTEPLQLKNVTTSYIKEGDDSCDGHESSKGLRIVGQLDYSGKPEVDVDLTGAYLQVDGLQLRGILVIELVRLRAKPPWFSGVRVYFPNPPDLDLTYRSRVLGVLNADFSFVRRKLVGALSTVLARAVVLPNVLGVPMGEGISAMDLSHPPPKGVLRLAVVEANSLLAAGVPAWRAFFRRREAGQRVDADPYVEVSVGAKSHRTPSVKGQLDPNWGEECVFDFVVFDPSRQLVRAVVHDEDYNYLSWKPSDLLGRAEARVDALAMAQRAPDLWLPLTGDVGPLSRGRLRLKAQWRPLAELGRLGCSCGPQALQVASLLAADHKWDLGMPSGTSWLLKVDTYYASGLPPEGAGQEHWLSLGLEGGSLPGKAAPRCQESPSALAESAAQLGVRLLQRKGSPAEVLAAFQSDDARARAFWRARVLASSAAAEEEQEAAVEGLPSRTYPVDAVWDHTIFFLIDALTSASLSVKVLRPQKGSKRTPENSQALEVASLRFELVDLLERPKLVLQEHLQLDSGGASSSSSPAGRRPGQGQMKLRLQVWPLGPPKAKEAGLAEKVGQVAERLMALRQSIDTTKADAFGRRMSKFFAIPEKPSGEEGYVTPPTPTTEAPAEAAVAPPLADCVAAPPGGWPRLSTFAARFARRGPPATDDSASSKQRLVSCAPFAPKPPDGEPGKSKDFHRRRFVIDSRK